MLFLKFYILFSFIFFISHCRIPKPKYRGKVVQGKKSNIIKHPYLASIIHSKKSRNEVKCLCGGSILNKRWVLTAGHCIYEDSDTKTLYSTNKIDILVGSSECTIEGQIYKINKIVEHPDYKMTNENDYFVVNNDIGLIYLNSDLEFGLYIKPVRLLSPVLLKNRLPVQVVGHNCTAMGWGLLEEDARNSPGELYDVMLPLLKPNLCAEILRFHKIIINVNASICTLDPEGNKDVCTGDSGGPLMCSNYQVGIVSGGLGCARKNMPNLWTRVDLYYFWIKNIITPKKKAHPFLSSHSVLHPIVITLSIVHCIQWCI